MKKIVKKISKSCACLTIPWGVKYVNKIFFIFFIFSREFVLNLVYCPEVFGKTKKASLPGFQILFLNSWPTYRYIINLVTKIARAAQ